MHKARTAWVLAVLLAGPAPVRAALPGVIFQISTSSPAAWKVAVHNVHNLERATGMPGTLIEVVVFSRAARILLKDSPVASELGALHASGVAIEACKASIRKAGLKPSAILPFVRYVPSSVAEVVRRERQGWAYVRP